MSALPDASRVDYEKYAAERSINTVRFGDGYGGLEAIVTWHAWQASRKSLVSDILSAIESEPDPEAATEIDRLKSVVDYNAQTGEFTWVSCSGNRSIGDIAGSTHPSGYRVIKIFKKNYRGHVLAWFMSNGYWPSASIDHINGERDDNRLSNLREATVAQNSQNKRCALPNSKSGLLGAHLMARSGKWVASIVVDKKKIHLGSFSNPEDAHDAYVSAKRKLHSFCTI